MNSNVNENSTKEFANKVLDEFNELTGVLNVVNKKHEEDINELKEKTTETSKDVAILMKEVKRLNKIIENLSTTDIEGITL